jgi:hypothetical protein
MEESPDSNEQEDHLLQLESAELAQTLDRTMEAVRAYLRMSPTSLVASRSLTRPQLQQRDFATFVKSSLLSNEEKERWLKEAPDPALKE